ncbi:efflux RND transporter periplasmic adaptor subunit [Dyadobacter pollutisoli]|uniref:Efflux RND transporter periplasmic adaptor subunit n=1 Tax=Dyadobacter pollutisoli TaxID=2910158 RepID=A0A9E8SPQ4_9BACT|nr:efflux RND transporter periplasmic adaptor subunit [Dyadobacter pollutisoli]WAC14971.1 efflux RND transporter periplasmic adaptor subunit [Dyadobacter pollutisoli]
MQNNLKYLIYWGMLSLLLGCSGKEESEAPATSKPGAENMATLNNEQIQNAAIALGTPQTRAVSSILKLNGKIDVPPQNIVSISVPLGGYLKTTRLLPGTHVKKGEVLAVMEDQQYIQLQQDYLTGKARLTYLERDFNRQQELNVNKSSSDKILQQAEAEYRSQQVMIRSLEEKLSLIGINPGKLSGEQISRSINIYSPINGYVSSVNVNIGKYVSPTDVLFELINPSDIHLALKVFEKDLAGIRIGQKLMAYSNSEPEKRYWCEVILIGKNLSPERTAEVHCHFERYEPSLVPGTFMNATIDLETRNAITLPEDAIVSFENREYIFLPKAKGQYAMTEVQSGTTENGFTEITAKENLTGRQVVVKGAYSLLMSLKNKSED